MVLYVSGKKPHPYPKGWMGQLLWVLYHTSLGLMDSIQNIMLMIRMEDKLTPIKLKNWTYRTVSL